jgi:prolyl oligopeptidase
MNLRTPLPVAFLLACASCATPSPAPPPKALPVAPPPVVAAKTPSGAPITEVRLVTDSYHGISVADPYRWLEDGKSEAVRAWTAAQNTHARERLDALPGRAAIAQRVAQVLEAPQVAYPGLRVAGPHWFVLVDAPPKQQRFLVVMPPNGDPKDARVVLDPNVLDATGKTTIDWYEPSHDGARIAVSLSSAGTESGDLHIVDVATGAVSERIPRVNGGTAGGHAAWTPKGDGLYYTRYPRAGERPPADLDFYQQLYYHQLGTDTATDRYELGKDFPRIAEIRVYMDVRTQRVLVSMQKGDGGEFAHYLRAPSGAWRPVARYEDKLTQVAFGPKDDLFAISEKISPRGQLIQINAATLDLAKAKVIYAPKTETMVAGFWDPRTLLFGAKRWYGTFQLGGPSEVRAFDYAGKPAKWSAPIEVASVRGLMPDGKSGVMVRAESYVSPTAWYRFDEATGKTIKTKLEASSPIDMSSYDVVREMATSKDGTQVPVTVLMPRGPAMGGSHPCVVTGYGGYGISLEPRFDPEAALWLEQGVVYAVANLRGGGEFGEEWHLQGNLERKQNVFDDFSAVLRHMILRGYTRSERLGIIGGSNGGLLMGATVVQNPELVRAAVSYVGIYDSLRSELSPNGEFNVTEFGTVQDKGQFDALYAYSPYHRVTDGVPYPATLLLTGENDPRVDPWHSRKMAARMQAASAGPAPILLRTSADAGHGGGSDLDHIVSETTDVYAFMLHALGVRVSAMP